MDDLIDIGLGPPHSALSTEAGATSSNATALPNSIHTSSGATPTGSAATSTPPVRDVVLLLYFPQVVWIHPPQPDEERTLQEWWSSELVSLPSTALPASDGTVLLLNQREREELSDHLRSGHSSKSNLCRRCLQADGFIGQ